MNLKIDQVCSRIVNFITASYLDGDESLDSRTRLIDMNIIDSASLFDVVDFIKSEFDVRMPLDEIHPDNFENAEILGQLVLKLANQEN